MDTRDILRVRLRAQLIEGSAAATPLAVVSRLLAMQAQDYAGATWAIGLRLPGATLAVVEQAIAEGTIVRTWPMRGTLHFVAAEDVRWMLALLTPRTRASALKREHDARLDAGVFARARDLFVGALQGNRRLTRPAAMDLLEAGGIPTTGQRGYYILWRLAQDGLIVLGPVEGRQQTFALLEEWVPVRPGGLHASSPREQMLAVLATRYFGGHGPATLADLARWAGIPKRDARDGLEAAADTLESAEVDGERYWFAPQAAEPTSAQKPSVHLLPGFDEYMLGYTGRSHQLGEHLERYGSQVASNGMLAPAVIADGRAVGIWKRSLGARTVSFAVTEFQPLTRAQRAAVAVEQARYARFVGRDLG